MAYEESIPSMGTSVGAISVQDLTGDQEYRPQLEIVTSQFGMGEATVEESAALFQKVVTALEAHPDLRVVGASRTFQSGQPVTP